MDAILLLAALLAPLQESAETAFNKIEAALSNAKTVRISFTIEDASPQTIPGKGQLTIEENGRSSLTASLRSKNEILKFSEEFDGRKVVSTVERLRVEAVVDPRSYRANHTVYLSRIGILTGMFAMHGFWSAAGGDKGISLDLAQLFQVKNIRRGDDWNGFKGITYELKSAVQPMPLDTVKLWYNPDNYRIARREYRIKGPKVDETIIEMYTDVQYGDDKKPAAPVVTDAEMDTMFFKAKLQVAESHLSAGRKEKAAEILEELIKTYPKHSYVPVAQKLLDEAKKK